MILQLIISTLLMMVNHNVVFNKVSFILGIYYMIYYPLWLFVTTLLVNLLAIKITSGPAFVIVAGMQFMGIALLNLWDGVLSVEKGEYVERNLKLLEINPMAHLVLGWHNSEAYAIKQAKNLININMDMNVTTLYFAVLSVVILIIGILIVNRQDVIVSNMETGGM